ncbi:hypothetical protein Q7P37_001527 [Cladosporium fusiforme]
MLPGLDTALDTAASKAFSLGANKVDKWTKNRDEHRTDSLTGVGVHTLEFPQNVVDNGRGGTWYTSEKHRALTQLPMFPIYSPNDEHAVERGMKAAAQMRSGIVEVNPTPLQRMVMSFSGGSMIFAMKKAENAAVRFNAQSSEDRVAQKHFCMLSRWTMPKSNAQDTGQTLLADILEFRTYGPMNMNGVTFAIKMNADARMNFFGKFTVDLKRGKAVTKMIRGLEVDEKVFLVLEDGSKLQMDLVACETRSISLGEIHGGMRAKHRGTLKRFKKEWVVPVV